MIKAVYEISDVEHPFTHDLETLLKGCVDNGWLECTKDELDAARKLTIHAVKTRYEYAIDITKGEAEASVIEPWL